MDETILNINERIHVQDYNTILTNGTKHLLIDVRPKIQYEICSLSDSVHIPIEELENKIDQVKEMMSEKEITSDNGKND